MASPSFPRRAHRSEEALKVPVLGVGRGLFVDGLGRQGGPQPSRNAGEVERVWEDEDDDEMAKMEWSW